jgi:hypothetical protein
MFIVNDIYLWRKVFNGLKWKRVMSLESFIELYNIVANEPF